MKNLLVKMLFPVSVAILISGCNKEVTVEDGAVVNATIIDSSNKSGLSDDNSNLYKFKNFIIYPVYAKGGFVDLNEDGIYNKNIESKLQFEMQASKGKVITAITTLLSKMTSTQVNTFKKDLDINDLYKLPSEDKHIYILSELIVEKFITKDTTLLNNQDIEDIKSKYKEFDFNIDASLSTKEFAKKRETLQIKKLRELGKIKENLALDLDNQIPNIDVSNIINAFEGELVNLDASKSFDVDGEIVSFKWSEGNSILSEDETFVKNDFTLGTHIITLVISDDKGAKASDEIIVNINKKIENKAPIAKAGNDRSIKEGESISFDGSLSTDSDGEIVSYQWTYKGLSLSNEKTFTKNDFEVGTHTITLEVTDNKGSSSSDTLVVEVTKDIVIDEYIKIHEIQGESSSTAMANQTVSVEAIVIADYQDKGVKGFYIQEEDSQIDNNENTSEGIFVYDKNNLLDVSVGDKVRVSGTAAEFYNLTQIKDLTSVSIVSSNNTLPSEKIITLPMDSSNSYEKYEGMLVKYTQDLNVTDLYNLGKYGEVLLTSANRLWIPTQIANPGDEANTISNANKLNQIILDDLINGSYPKTLVHPKDGLSKSNVIRVGDKTSNLKAVMSYGFNKYRLLPIAEVEFTQSNPRPNTIEVAGNLKVASINVLNYFRTIDDGSSICGSHTQGCRGADSIEERDRQNAKMIIALEKMDADIIGLMEIENDGGITAKYIADSLTGYDYVRNPKGESFLGDDVITVAFLYKKDKVQLVGNSKTIKNGQYQSIFDTRNRKPLAQTFKHIETKEVFTVINNHYKSKGSGCGAGDDSTNGQGNCNGTRTKASEDILTWIEDLKTSIKDNDFLIIGDLNAYAKEDPIVTLENGGFKNLDGNTQTYSYIYYGQAGTLDYALASNTLNTKVKEVKRWFINSDEAWVFDYNNDTSSKNYGKPKPSNYLSDVYEANEFRMSDHDPIIVGFDFKEGNTDTNKAPIANAGEDKVLDEGSTVSFDGSLSSDSEGSIVSYEWKEGNTILSTEMMFSKNDLAVGVHNITLIVTDDKGLTSFDNILVTINSTTTTPPSLGSKVFISEYVEGGGNNKALEIYNGSDKTISMSDYKLIRYSNGKTSGANITLDEVLVNPNEVFVIVHSSANSDFKTKADQLSGNISHNGDDAYSLVLNSNDEVLDVFGQIGFDPGSSWSVNSVSTKDRTLRRKTNITSGDTIASDVFDPSLQWDSFPKDTYDGLGIK